MCDRFSEINLVPTVVVSPIPTVPPAYAKIDSYIKVLTKLNNTNLENKLIASLKEMKQYETEIKLHISKIKKIVENTNKEFKTREEHELYFKFYLSKFNKAKDDCKIKIEKLEFKVKDWYKRQLKFTNGFVSITEDVNNNLDEKQLYQSYINSEAEDISDLENNIDNIQNRHDSILALENDVKQLSELFQELDTLVNMQGEKLDSIELCILNSKDCVDKGEVDIVEGEKYQNKAKKRMCCLGLIVISVLFIVLAPVLNYLI
jgi:t-SNARE complex subunit (syntaxin)